MTMPVSKNSPLKVDIPDEDLDQWMIKEGFTRDNHWKYDGLLEWQHGGQGVLAHQKTPSVLSAQARDELGKHCTVSSSVVQSQGFQSTKKTFECKARTLRQKPHTGEKSSKCRKVILRNPPNSTSQSSKEFILGETPRKQQQQQKHKNTFLLISEFTGSLRVHIREKPYQSTNVGKPSARKHLITLYIRKPTQERSPMK
ncbi:hypothetical protein GH733_016002 [Mirounga leonina]|nr:hypothetical protein GH733_016002 [Mirounga leonina]